MMGRFILKLAAYSFPSLFFSSTNQQTAPCTRVMIQNPTYLIGSGTVALEKET